jgi:uncharacterized protein YdeI (YjbR/CyaY-like superfamily)
MPKSMPKSKSFRAALERLRPDGLGWIIARLPFSARDIWGRGGRLRVRVEVNGFSYRTSLFPTRTGEHFILVNKKMQRAAGIRLGSVATFTVTLDLDPREVVLPKELERALDQDRSLRKWFNRLNYSIRKWLADSVADAKGAETRTRRAERVAEQVMEAMEAERELPPMMRLALNRYPGAEQAWRRLSETQRRGNLLAVFYYRTPQSRIKRMERMIEQALAAAEKAKTRTRD